MQQRLHRERHTAGGAQPGDPRYVVRRQPRPERLRGDRRPDEAGVCGDRHRLGSEAKRIPAPRQRDQQRRRGGIDEHAQRWAEREHAGWRRDVAEQQHTGAVRQSVRAGDREPAFPTCGIDVPRSQCALAHPGREGRTRYRRGPARSRCVARRRSQPKVLLACTESRSGLPSCPRRKCGRG